MPEFVIGPIEVPDVDDLGTAELSAISTIEGAHLVPQIARQYSDTIPEGEVISQDPAPGTEVEPLSLVTIVVSRGPDPFLEAGCCLPPKAKLVTLSDTSDLPDGPGIVVPDAAGAITVIPEGNADDEPVTFNLRAGERARCLVRRVKVTGTDPITIHVMYY